MTIENTPWRPRRAAAGMGALLALAGCGVSPADPPAEPVEVPFVVSDLYSPDGFFGDGETRGQLELEKQCPQRQPGAEGDCYTISYHPGVKRFAGIFWQFPHNNWGFWPGYVIAAGAKRITFRARGEKGGESVSFGAGQTGTPNPHNDAFKLDGITKTLTTAWQDYEIPFFGNDYQSDSGVIGAFMVSFPAGDDDQTVRFYVDDIRWAP